MHLTFHRSIFWAHLVCGLMAGLIILSMSVSGLLIAYEVQLKEWINRDLRVTPPAAEAVHLDIEALVVKVQEGKPGLSPTGFTWKADPEAPVTLTAERGGPFYANPYTGDFLGEGNHTWHEFFHDLISWHRFLAGTGLSREAGKMITGAGTLVFGILLVSGLYLWWPRHWRWMNVRAVLFFNRSLKGRARDWNWHNVFGFWSAAPMLFIILTGLIISYPWATNLLYHATGNEPPPPRPRATAPAQTAPAASPAAQNRPATSLAGVAPLLAEARAQVPGWASLNLRLPSKPGSPFPVMVDRGGRGQVHLRTHLNLDVAQQKVLPSPDDIRQQNLGRRLRMYARYLHTGELFGFLGQTVAALCALAATLLTWTGFALAWRRFFGKKAKASAA